MGAMTMLASALITGGVGPWLPGQMITAGWLGQSAALLPPIINRLGWNGKPLEIITLAAFSAVWGITYGFIMSLWFWPFLAVSPGMGWSQSADLLVNIQRYLAYYLGTSLVWDITRAIGNMIVFSVMSRPVIKILKRFIQRFKFEYQHVGQS